MSADTHHEQAIALGTVTITAGEAAKRLGYRGKKGLERFRAACAAKVIPAFRDGKAWRIHWPTVTAALFRAPAHTFPGRVVGNPSKARFLDSYGAADGCISKTTTQP